MVLKQSTLNFEFATSTTSLTALPQIESEANLHLTATSMTMDGDPDTIVVDASPSNPQLPTPSESVTDVSSQGSHAADSRKVMKSRLGRVPKTRKSRFTEGPLSSPVGEQSRNVSGDTLVAHSESTASLIQKGVRALDLPWNMSDVFLKGSKANLVGDAAQSDTEAESQIVVCAPSMDDADDNRRAAARKIKMLENARKWDERKKAAEKGATRKSKRASILGRVGELISDAATTVLGKRGRELTDAPLPKKIRLSNENTTPEETPMPKKNQLRREKKWLSAGLYAGQPRVIGPYISANKGKRKDLTPTEPLKENTILPLPMYAGERLLKHGRDFKLPFDVFSPLPAGQPKPDEWRKVNKNVFIGDAAQEWRNLKFNEHSACHCLAANGCGEECMNRYMYYECDSNNCNLPPEVCGNRAFEGLKARLVKGGKYNVGVEVIKTADRGYGVRSNRMFAPNQIIIEYTGEICTQEECERRMRTIYKDNECYYLMLFDQNMIIDATRGSIARFVNHSCEPNCRMEKWTVGGKPRMALFAGERGIMTGEELTYDYNFDPYSQKNVQECRCGAMNCRGVLGPKPKPVKQSSPDETAPAKKKESKLVGVKRKLAEVVEESTLKLNKKHKAGTSTKKVKARAATKVGKSSPSSKVIAVKKITAKKVSLRKTTARPPSHGDSKLKKILSKGPGRVKPGKEKRATSQGSGRTVLLEKEGNIGLKKSVGSKSSLTEKARKAVRSVRGDRSKVTDTIEVKA